MKPTRIEIERLAHSFRCAPAAPSHHSADTWNSIEQIGGRTAIAYGMFLATPRNQRWKKHDRGLDVASALEAAAQSICPTTTRP